MLATQRVCKSLADLIAGKNVGLDVDVVMRLLDRGKHRLVSLRAIDQQARVIATNERYAGLGLNRSDQLFRPAS